MSIFEYFSGLGNEFALFIISMIPLIELRGAIPVGAAVGMSWQSSLVISVIGNILPVPFIILFGRHVLSWLKKTKLFSKLAHKFEKHVMKKADKVMRYSSLGLFLFVAVPIPGTGAWSGAALAALLDMRFKYALPAICGGVLVAGIIMTIGSYGLLNVFQLF